MFVQVLPKSQAHQIYNGNIDLGSDWLELEADLWETLELIRREDPRIWTEQKAIKLGFFLEYVRDTANNQLPVKFTNKGNMGIIIGELEKPDLLMVHKIDIVSPNKIKNR